MIDIKNLHVSLTSHGVEFHALQGINLTLREGEKLGIVGESGCGKTLLMKSILGLLPPNSTITSGEICYQSTNLCNLSEKQFQRIRGKEIGMIFQDPMTSLNPTLKIKDQIMEGLLHHFPNHTLKSAKERALQLLVQVGISSPELRLEQYPHLLSGGLRQRVLIAIALAAEPKVLIADEPTTALDVTVQAQIIDLLRHLQQNKSTLLITHDLSLVAAFCDRVAVMYAGQIVEEAPAVELFANPKHPYTRRLLQSIPRIDISQEQLHPIPGTPPDLSRSISGCPFCPRCAEAMPICQIQNPPFVHNTRCWLYEPIREFNAHDF